MERGLGYAINRTLRGDTSPFRSCGAASDFQVFSIKRTGHDPTQSPAFKPRLVTQNIHAKDSFTLADDDSQLQLAVVPVIVGRHPSRPGAPYPGSAVLLQHLFQNFDLPDVVLSCFLANRFQFSVFPVPSSPDTVLLLNFRQWTIAWRSNSSTGKIQAVLLWMSATWARSEIADHVKDFLEDIAQTDIGPESVGILGVLLCARHVASSLAELDSDAFSTERKLRQVIQSADLEHVDELGDLSATHSYLASRAIRERSRASVATSYLEFLLDNHRKHGMFQDSATRKTDLEALHLLTKSLVAQAAKVSEDANMHISTIYNLIAQRDQATNLAIAAASREIALQSKIDQANSIAIADASKRIAEEAKKDSSAMKMIAIVTMVYLPGTFVATCFSMGIFEWSASPSNVVNPRIWVYFLFTAVLTILTIGGFLAWLWWQDRLSGRVQVGDEGRNENGGATSTYPEPRKNTDLKQSRRVQETIGPAPGSQPSTALPWEKERISANEAASRISLPMPPPRNYERTSNPARRPASVHSLPVEGFPGSASGPTSDSSR